MKSELVRNVDGVDVYPQPIRTEYKLLAKARIENPSLSVSEIAMALGRNPQTVHMWLRRPDYQAYETWLLAKQNTAMEPTMALPTPRERKQMVDQINEFAEEMFERLQVIVETSNDNKLLTSIAQDALDRAGYVTKRTTERTSPQFILTAEAMEVLLRREAEALGNVIVGEIVPTQPQQTNG